MTGTDRPTPAADGPAPGADGARAAAESGAGRPVSGERPCVCGHPRTAHRHYRRGSDCAVCGPEVCPRYRPVRWWRRPAKADRAAR